MTNTNDPYREPFPNIFECLSKSCCSQKTLKKRLPIIQWLPHYDTTTFLFDVIAGLSVALTLIPQGIAFAIIAGISPHYGLYSCFMGSFCYAIFGSCKEVTVGPTAIMALLTYSPVHQFNADFAFLGTFLIGCIIFTFGALNLGFLIQFISMPIISGFVIAAVITIGSSQLKLLLGIKSGASGDFMTALWNIFKHIDEICYMDTIFGLISLFLLFVMNKPKCLSQWPIVVKYLTISCNVLIVILGIIVSYLFYINDMEPFELAGTTVEGLPEFKFPPIETEINYQKYGFFDMGQGLGLWLFTLPLVSIIESIAISKTFSKGKIVEVKQEIIALGLCNIASSFFRSLPLSGTLLRSAINHNSGVKTPGGGVITGCIVLLALSVISKTFYLIPKISLAAIDNNDILIITPGRSLNYSSAEFFKSTVIKKVTIEFVDVQYILINGVAMNNIFDTTAAKNIVSLIDDLQENGKQIYFWNWEKSAFHLIVRYNKNLHDLFRFGNDLNEIVSSFKEISKSRLTIATIDETI